MMCSSNKKEWREVAHVEKQLSAVSFISPLSLMRNLSYTFFTYPTGISTVA